MRSGKNESERFGQKPLREILDFFGPLCKKDGPSEGFFWTTHVFYVCVLVSVLYVY